MCLVIYDICVIFMMIVLKPKKYCFNIFLKDQHLYNANNYYDNKHNYGNQVQSSLNFM